MPAGTLSSYVRTYITAPRYAREHRRVLTTADGVRLDAAHLPGPAGSQLSVVLVHGFVNWSRSPRVHAFAQHLAAHAEVIVPDMRGHGRSGGACTFGWREPLDVAAAVDAATPGRRVVTIGASMGGAAVLLHAATSGGVDGVVSVSAPAWWGRSDRHGAARVRRWTATPARRAVLTALVRTRMDMDCPAATDPVDVVPSIAPAWTMLVHDPDDAFFGPEHAEALHAAASEPKDLWWVPGGGHGTDLFTSALAERLLARVIPPPR